jgi:protein SCO1
MITRKTLSTITIIIALIAFGSGIGIFSARQQRAQLPPPIQGMMWPNPKSLQAFSTIDEDGEEFGLENLQGKWSFLFFGYTHCPDICPITLTVLDKIYDQLESQQQQSDVQMIFVSVDPQRDTSEQLHSYVSYFNEEFRGLGGSLEQIQGLTKQLGIAYFHDQPTATGDYMVDHSASIFLIDPQGEMIAIMSAPHKAEDILARFLSIRSFIDKQAKN